MSVKIGHASISEKGTIYGTKGDSTKKEVCTRTWYSLPWDFMAIHPDATVREKHAAAIEAACANDNIGYGQYDRNTLNDLAKKVNYNLAKITKKCNCDCSSLQNVCAIASGAKKVTYGSNGWTTRNMKSHLKAAGYIIIDDKAYLKSAVYCVRGAIYVTAGNHTVTALGNGSSYKKTLSKAGLSATPTVTASKDNKVSVTAITAADPAKSKNSKLSGTYVTTGSLHMRTGAGTNKKSMVILPKGTEVKNYGYYTETSTGTKWLYVSVTYNKIKYTGFCSNAYLKKK